MLRVLALITLITVSCNERQPNYTFNSIKVEPITAKETEDYSKILDTILKTAKEGNLIFRGGTDVESNIIRDFSYNNKMFSHCGILLNTDSGLCVAHMLGGETNKNGGILFQPINSFLSFPQNESCGIYDISLSQPQICEIKKYADSIKNAGVGFDMKFDLNTKQNLYCTELLVDAFRSIFKNDTIFKETVFNLKNTKYAFLINKPDSFAFYPIDVFQYNKLLTKKAIFKFPNYSK